MDWLIRGRKIGLGIVLTLLVEVVVYFAATAKDPVDNKVAIQQPPVAASAKQLPDDMLDTCHTGSNYSGVPEKDVRGFCPGISVGVDMDNSVDVNEMSWYFPGRAQKVDVAIGYGHWMPAFTNDNPEWSSGHNYDDQKTPGKKYTIKLQPLAHDQRLVCWAFLTNWQGETWLQRIPQCGQVFDGAEMEVPAGLRGAVFYIYDSRIGNAAAWTPTWGVKTTSSQS